MSDPEYELVTLRNGARAVRNTRHGEVMHPSVGPWAEANRLYVDQLRLRERLGRGPVRVYDVGLGAAANACAALDCEGPLQLISFENDLAPLKLALTDPAGFPFVARHRAACEALIARGEFGAWKLLLGDFSERLADAPAPVDLIFFDPFSPDTNPSMWTRATFGSLRARCGEDSMLATYSASTAVRADLVAAGFFVGAGWSVGTKSETTVAATRLASLEKPLGARWLQRFRRSPAFTAERDSALSSHPQFGAGARGSGPPTTR